MGGLSHSDESMRRGNASRRVFYDKRNARVASGVETDKHKPGYQSATEDNEIAPGQRNNLRDFIFKHII